MKTNFLDVVVFAAALSCTLCWALRRKRAAPYPPGPKGLPIVGNILDMPGKDEWEAARRWGEQYGELVSVGVFGTRYLFLNSYDAAVDLFEKRGNIYSSRPRIPMAELQGWADWLFPMMPYGVELRKIRQLFHTFAQKSVTTNYYGVQTQSMHKFLGKLLKKPDAYREHIKHSTVESIIMVVYGFEVVENDPYVGLADKGAEAVSEGSKSLLINAIPALRHLPTWFLGIGFYKKVKEGRKLSTAMYHEPYNKAKRLIANGTAVPSATSRLIAANTIEDGSIVDENIIAKAVGAAYIAAGDTIVSVLLTSFLAMVLYPEALRKGQEELDKVIGRNTLPNFEDRSKLPYINAICNECLRWQPVGGIGFPHCTETDDVYKGYFIPAKTNVFANIWAMLRNPKDYPQPDKFIPERWLSERPPRNANEIVFGFGRRICPGRHFAENAIFIGVASILSVFNIEKALDASGAPITPEEDYTSNITRQPKPFKCKITPRSDEAIALIRAACSVPQ